MLRDVQCKRYDGHVRVMVAIMLTGIRGDKHGRVKYVWGICCTVQMDCALLSAWGGPCAHAAPPADTAWVGGQPSAAGHAPEGGWGAETV